MIVATSPVRRRFVELLVGVAALHVLAISLYYVMDVRRLPVRQQQLFAWAWMGGTVTIVFVGLQRIKRARRTRLGIRA